LTSSLATPACARSGKQLAAASNSSEAIYQTPAFADFLATCAAPQQRFHLYGAYTASHQPLGLIPLLHTGLATRVTQRWYQRQQLVLLGSSPLLPPEPALLDALHDFLLTEFPRVQALVYRALPHNHAIWLHLQQSSTLLPLALHGWRGCHSMALPSSYAEYLNRQQQTPLQPEASAAPAGRSGWRRTGAAGNP
jgi:hypothetical protein